MKEWQFWLLMFSLWNTAQHSVFTFKINKIDIAFLGMWLFCLIKLIASLV